MSEAESEESFEAYDQSQLLPSVDDEDSFESESDNENVAPAKKPRGPDVEYALQRSFASVGHWAQERTRWRMKGTHSLENSDVQTWFCEYGRKKGYACKHRLRIEFPHDSNSVDIFRAEVEHDHEAVASVNPLSAAVKEKIREYARARIQPQRIRVLLLDNGIQPLPSLAQIQNFVQRLNDKTPSTPFSDVQLKAYCNSSLPGEDPNKPFVLRWEYVDSRRFFVLWTTRNLLSLQKAHALLQADATNCVNWECYPLGVYGYSDCNRRFQPTCLSVATSEDTYHYSSVLSALAADGYEPVFAHVDRRLKKRLSSVPANFRDRIRLDVDALRYARTPQEFTQLAGLMMDSWPPEAQEFTQYFRSTYATGDLSRWYESASPFVSNNNGLEATNRTIKDAHTLRRKLPFGQFLQECESALRSWSIGAELPPSKPTPRPSLYIDAYKLGVGATKRLVAKLPGRDVYVFASSTSKLEDLNQLKAAYRAFTADSATWMQFLAVRFKVHVVRKVTSDEATLYVCSCSEGARKRLCKHALFIMCSPDVSMYTYPEEATAVPLEGRRKRGRPRKTQAQNRYAVNY